MFKYMVILAFVACAAAAPQVLLRSAIDNEGAKQIGLPFANGWTDGPNNGVGPVIAAYSPLVHSAVVHSPVVHSPVVHAAYHF